ncbi:hypothetical protein Bbelb_380540 [Branchiostoma belcheri]|nr:hypothetical protein Bbelb_380540 [Branchiostoma belcheri]
MPERGWRPSSSTSEVSQHIHIESPGHTVTLDKVRILDTEQDYFVRGVKEAIYIRAHQPSLNRDGGRYRLPATFDALLTSSRFRLPETACAASSGPRFPQCRKAGWLACVPFTDKPGIDSITGVCVVCEVQNEDAGVDEVAIKGYPFHVISAEKLAQLDSSEIDTLALIDAKIVDVKNNTFSEFSRLRKMSLDSNRLTDVKQTWFTGLESLFALILSNNNNVMGNIDFSAVNINPGRSCGDLDSSLSTISIQAPVVVLASKASMADKLDTKSPELCRQMSYTTVQDLEVVQAPDRVLIPITVSTAVVLVMSFLAVLLWRLCAEWLNSEDDRASDDTHVWTIPPGVAFPGLLRSASLPTYSDKMASNDAVSCRSLPAVLHSIEPTYSEIPDDEACAHGEVHGLQHVPVPTHTYSEIPDDDACAQGHLRGFQHVPVLTHTYSEIPDDGARGPIAFYSNFEFPLCADGNRRQDRRLLGGNRITSSRQRSGSSIATYGSTGQANDQRNPYYRNPSLAQGITARRQLRTALVSRPDQDVRTYVNVTDAIMSGCIDIRRAHIAFLTLPDTCWSWENLGQGSRSTAQFASLPTVTLPDTYWPWEIPGEGTNFTRRPVSLSTVTLPNTYWPWEIPGDGTQFTRRRVSLPTVTLPNTYWPWEIPGKGTRNTPRRASLPTVTLPNTYWPWEIPGKGTRNTPRRASLPTVTLPNTYWPWEIPGKGTRNTPRRASLPTVTLPNTYWPWEIPGDGTQFTRRRVSLPTVTLPNTYWPWEIPGKGTRNTPRRASLPTVTLPNTYWPWEIPGEGTRNTPRRASLPTVTLPNTYWPWEIPGEGTSNTPRRASLPTVTLPNTYWPWEITGEGTRNTPRRASLPTVTLPNTYWPWEIQGEETRNTARRASLPSVTLPNTYWPWEIPGEGTRNTARRAFLPTVTLPNTYWPWEIPGEGTRNTARRASLPTVTLPNTYWPWEIQGDGRLMADSYEAKRQEKALI